MIKVILYYLGFGYQPKYNDQVIITSGFYRGKEAVVYRKADIGPEVWVSITGVNNDLINPWNLKLK